LFLKRRENREREREREKTRRENSKTEERGYIIFKFSPLLNKNRKEVINEEEEEDGESPVKIPVRAEKDRRVPRGRGDG
tara:strand:- start:671 stop:907 length:237 start_codon:yes stop_codon:yes gene_type:complete